MLIYTVTLDYFFIFFIHLQLSLRITLVIILVGIPGFFMGIPFPGGLSLLKDRDQYALPLAWGVNGFLSVISIISAAICAVITGYRCVLVTAVVCYMAAGFVSLIPEKMNKCS